VGSVPSRPSETGCCAGQVCALMQCCGMLLNHAAFLACIQGTDPIARPSRNEITYLLVRISRETLRLRPFRFPPCLKFVASAVPADPQGASAGRSSSSIHESNTRRASASAPGDPDICDSPSTFATCAVTSRPPGVEQNERRVVKRLDIDQIRLRLGIECIGMGRLAPDFRTM